MRTAFIFHGTAGYPGENWFPWLKDELSSLGYDVHVPQFPTPENQTLDAWFAVFEPLRSSVDGDTIMVGHSLGGSFLLRVLESLDAPIALAALVAAPVGVPPIKNWEGDQPFIGRPFDWPLIRSRAKKFLVFQSDDDPYVSLGNGEEAAKQLGVSLTFIPHAGHFNKAAGYLTFDPLLEKIQRLGHFS